MAFAIILKLQVSIFGECFAFCFLSRPFFCFPCRLRAHTWHHKAHLSMTIQEPLILAAIVVSNPLSRWQQFWNRENVDQLIIQVQFFFISQIFFWELMAVYRSYYHNLTHNNSVMQVRLRNSDWSKGPQMCAMVKWGLEPKSSPALIKHSVLYTALHQSFPN